MLQRGHVEAFDELFHRHKQPLLTFLTRSTGDAAMADDLFQQVFLRLYERADSYEGGSSVKTWIYSIAVNAARDQFRRDRIRRVASLDRRGTGGTGEDGGVPEPQSAAPSPIEQLAANELAQRLDEALQALEEDYRAPFVLARVNGMTYQEVAEALDLTVPTVRMRVFRAHHRLTSALGHLAAAQGISS